MKEVVIIGGGLAACASAVSLAENGFKVSLYCKSNARYSHSVSARGGMNAAVNHDDIELHYQDTIKSGVGLVKPDKVRQFCQQAPHIIEWLEGLGVNFDVDESKQPRCKPFSGNTIPRARYSGQRTGLKCLTVLIKKAKQLGVTFLERKMVTHLIDSERQIIGIGGFDLVSGTPFEAICDAVVLATGGYAGFFATTTNAVDTTGDGIAIAARAGAMLRDMEMVQFHPLGLQGKGVQIPEPVIGFGGQLLNDKMERFMVRYEPEHLEKVGRDRLSQCIAQEIRATNGTCVWLDLTTVADDKRHLLKEAKQLADVFGDLDIAVDNVPVTPSAHYSMGGIAVDGKNRVLTAEGKLLAGVWAVGECACSELHGANRLGGNSLLEVIWAGRQIFPSMSEYFAQHAGNALVKKSTPQRDGTFGEIFAFESWFQWQEEIKTLMDEYSGVLRHGEGLTLALDQLEHLSRTIKPDSDSVPTSAAPPIIKLICELRNQLLLAQATCFSAMQRKESRGAHCREDFPQLGSTPKHIDVVRRDCEWHLVTPAEAVI